MTDHFVRPASDHPTPGFHLVTVPGMGAYCVSDGLAQEVRRLVRVGNLRAAVTLMLWFGATPPAEEVSP